MTFPTVSPQIFSDDTMPQFDNEINGMAFGPSGEIYIGGSFSSVTTNLTGCIGVADVTTGDPVTGIFPRVKTAGGLFAAAPDASAITSVSSVVSDGNGGWYVGGGLRNIAGMPSTWDNLPKLAIHVLPNGSIDPDFHVQITDNSQANYAGVNAMHFDQANNVLYLGGQFPMGDVDQTGNSIYYALVAVDGTTGELLTSWHPNVTDNNGNNYNAVIVTMYNQGNNLYIGGDFDYIDSQPRANLALFNIASFPPILASFNGGTNDSVYTIASDGTNLYVGGVFSRVTSEGTPPNDPPFTRNNIARFDQFGQVDSWDPNANSDVYKIVYDSSGVYVGGFFSTIGGQTRYGTARLDSGTGLADSWDPHTANSWLTTTSLPAFCFLVDGTNVYMGGNLLSNFNPISSSPPTDPWNMVRVDITTALIDTAWAPNPSYQCGVFGLLKSGNNVIFWGDFFGLDCSIRGGMAKLTAGGDLDASFLPDIDCTPSSFNGGPSVAYLTVDAGARVAIAQSGAGGSPTGVSLLDPSTGLLQGSVVTNAAVNAIVQQPATTNFYIAGSFTSLGGTRSRVARILGDLSVDLTFPTPSFGSTAYSIYADAALGRVYVGGAFTSPTTRFAALTTAGALVGITTSFDDWVTAIGEFNSNIIVGGEFESYNSTTVGGLVAIDASGVLQTNYFAGGGGDPVAFGVANGRMYVCSNYNFVGPGFAYNNPFIREYLPGTDIPTSWNSYEGGGWSFYTNYFIEPWAVVANDTYVYVGTYGAMAFGGGQAAFAVRIKFPERVNLVGPDRTNGESRPIENVDLGTTNSGIPLFGVTGLEGNTGTQGITGIAVRGPYGQRLQGTTGTQGLTGLQGIAGITGLTVSGPIGPTGIMGLTGIEVAGRTGVQGQTGIVATTSNAAVNSTPFTVTANHHILLVDTSSTSITIQLPDPATIGAGKLYGIYDATGNAGNNNITITPNAGNINDQASYVLNINYGSADIYSSGSNYYARSFVSGITGSTGITGITGLAGA